ncbi:hypothetical protein [Paraburkholderia caribensis]|uniref:hypothetical protein n=1 Tax=Paraburkholderia caribensis TaxID=75105 RepID=UPI000B1FA825|nr:hypothetical protein [Paraburkholderia caribensis]
MEEKKKVNVLARNPGGTMKLRADAAPECIMASAERRAGCHCHVLSARNTALSASRVRAAQPHPVVHQELLLCFELRGQLRQIRAERVASLTYLEQLGSPHIGCHLRCVALGLGARPIGERTIGGGLQRFAMCLLIACEPGRGRHFCDEPRVVPVQLCDLVLPDDGRLVRLT